MAVRNKEYGDAIRFTGAYGACVELMGCVMRLHRLIISNPEKGPDNEKSIRNALLDAHNYAVIAEVMMNEGNWFGIDMTEEKEENA